MEGIFNTVIGYLTSGWPRIVELYLAVVGLASVVVKLTPSLKDDDVLKGIIRFLGKYIALNTDKGTSPKP